jgi:hypothetical protein
LTDAHNSASFNGTNVLTGSSQGIMNFALAFEDSVTGGAISTTGFTTQALSGGATVATTAQQPAIVDTIHPCRHAAVDPGRLQSATLNSALTTN